MKLQITIVAEFEAADLLHLEDIGNVAKEVGETICSVGELKSCKVEEVKND